MAEQERQTQEQWTRPSAVEKMRDAQAALSQSEEGRKINGKALLAVLFGTSFIAAFNENIINVGLMDIMAEFSVDSLTAQWLVTGYMMVTAVVVTTVAFLLRRFTLPQVFYGGSIILLAGSVVDLFAPNFAVLLVARLFQAIGTGIFIPTMMNTVFMVAPRKQLGTYLSIGSCCITFGPAFGPVVSGLMVTFFGWRSMFLPTVVVVALLMVLGAFFVRPLGETKRISFDTLSLVLAAGGLTCLIFGLIEIMSNPGLTVALVAACLVLIALFARRQRMLKVPYLNLTPMRTPAFSVACVLVVFSMMTTFSLSVLLPLYFEGAAGMTALVAGVLVLIPILVNAATALVGGRTMDRKGEWPLLPFGFLLIAVGMAFIVAVAADIRIALVVAGACVVYAGVGLVMSPSQTSGLKQIPRDLNAHGVTLMSVFIQVAACVGPSLYMGILSSSENAAMAQGATAAQAVASGFASTSVVATGIGIVGTVLAFFYARHAVKAAARAPKAETAAPQALSLSSVMQRDVYTVHQGQTVYEAIQQMLEHGTSGLPIVDDRNRVIGFISDGDIMKSLADQGQPVLDLTYSLSVFADDVSFDNRLKHLMTANVMDVATHQVVSVEADTSIERVCAVLGERRIKKLPVLERGRLVGTVSRTDVNRSLMSAFLKKAPNRA
ncbi:MAG: MFS transporter [Eggerthellaceae bacterium]|jgi:DHA2 family lincomycin resistance protein-like MFS transporter